MAHELTTLFPSLRGPFSFRTKVALRPNENDHMLTEFFGPSNLQFRKIYSPACGEDVSRLSVTGGLFVRTENMRFKSDKLDYRNRCTQTAAPNLRSDACKACKAHNSGSRHGRSTACASSRYAPAFQHIAASIGARIIQHDASMAAYNMTMTLLRATRLEWTDFAKPVIFSKGLIVLV